MDEVKGSAAMARARFPTARSLFETFPEAAGKAPAEPADVSSVEYLHGLTNAGKSDDALTFCAYLLPRREAVWWACRAVRALSPERALDAAPCLRAAEAWVQKPDEEHREAALQIATTAGLDDPVTWLARAAGWAGGMLVAHPKSPVSVPQYMTPRACRIAVLISVRMLQPPAERLMRANACVADAIALAKSGL